MSDEDAGVARNHLETWQNTDCPELVGMASDMARARDGGGTSGDLIAVFIANTVAWLMQLENRVRALEGKEPIRTVE